MLKKLIKLADNLDKKGAYKLASKLDNLIIALASGADGTISITDLIRLKPDAVMALNNAVNFDLVLEPDPKGNGNNVKAIPRIEDKWTDGLNLGDISKTPELQNYMMPGALNETMRQIEEGGWFSPDADIPTLSPEDVKFSPEELQKMRQENLQRGRQKQQEGRDLDQALSGAIKEVERESYLPENERSQEAINYDLPVVPPSGFSYTPEYRSEQAKQRREERKKMRDTEAEIRAELVKMADQLDQEGLHDLAGEIDHSLITLSSRPSAPLKKLDDDIKKNLIIFVHDADRNTEKSIKGLNELFRRMRYFDFSDAVKDLGLDRTVKDMERTRGSLEEAKKRFYEMMHGKKPSKKDLEDLFNSLVESIEEASEEPEEQNALDFFEEQLGKEEKDSDRREREGFDEEDDDEETEDEDLNEEDDDDLDEELAEFLASLHDEEEEEGEE